MKRIFILLIYLSTLRKNTTGVVRVSTQLGDILGSTMLSRDGRKFNAFLGVPYAEPPIGDLRFENPKPVKGWKNVINATSYPPICPQISPTGFIGNEDCLYLNIYAPQTRYNRSLPVWVFIYGGRRVLGHSLPYKYGPQYILDKPIILVIISYRIGPLGFLSTEDTAIPGNYGLKDQSEALKWIQKHINSFGGDPKNITLTGGSSGATDVSLHLFSPLSKGLFHRCISQSGQLLNFWTLQKPGNNRKHTWMYAKAAGCNVKTSEELSKCLKKKPVEKLIKATFSIMHDYFLPDVSFGAVIEHKYVEKAFFVENPAEAIQRSKNIPWILGVTSDEGALGSVVLFSNSKAVEHFDKHYRKIFPMFFGYEYSFNVEEITDTLRSKYLKNCSLIESFKSFGAIFGASHAYVGAIETALQYKGPKYFYVYDWKNYPDYVRNYVSISHGQKVGGMYIKHETGPIHGEELLSMFNYPSLFPPTIRGNDRIVSDQVLQLWYNFVANGDPNGSGRPVWQPVTSSNLEYLHINNLTLTMKDRFLWDEYQFWKQLNTSIIINSDTHKPIWSKS